MKEELVFLNKDFENKEELFKFISDKLNMLGYVKEGFFEGLKEREMEYPTGLQTRNMGIAIPHTEDFYVNKPCLSFLSLSRPLIFENMDGSIEPVEVELVFVLALDSSDGKIKELQNLSNIFMDDNVLRNLKNATEKSEVLEILEKRNI